MVLGAQNCAIVNTSQQNGGSILSVIVSVNNANCPSSNASLSVGAIAGIVVGVVALGAIVAVSIAFVRVYQNHKLEKDFDAYSRTSLKNGSPYVRM